MVADINMYQFTRHDSAAAMVKDLAEALALTLDKAISQRGEAAFAVSGGSSPKPLYEALSHADLNWSRVKVVLVDERWVNPGEPGSNADFIAATLLRDKAAKAHFIPLKCDAPSPHEGLDEVDQRLDALHWPLDVAVLGMGPDGHTASWFPDAVGLDNALYGSKRLAAVTAHRSEVTGQHVERITLTRRALDQCGLTLLMLQGAAKREAFDIACGPGEIAEMPVRALLRDPDFDLHTHWAP